MNDFGLIGGGGGETEGELARDIVVLRTGRVVESRGDAGAADVSLATSPRGFVVVTPRGTSQGPEGFSPRGQAEVVLGAVLRVLHQPESGAQG